MIRHADLAVEWLGYATIRIDDGDTVVYLDPGRYGVLDGYEFGPGTPSGASPGDAHRPEADVVCVTHDHHYDAAAIRRVAGPDATLVAFEGIDTHRIDRDVERPADLPLEVVRVDAESDLAVGEAIVRTTAAYNKPDGPRTRASGEPFHPPGLGCGFHVTLSGTSAYWPGDTDVLDGHDRLDVDVFCPPIGGAFTMDRREAADLAAALEPELVVPVHYDTFAEIETDADAFVADLESRGVPVVLDE